MKKQHIAFSLIIVAGIAAVSGFSFAHGTAQLPGQDYYTLDRRISQLEQRLYTIDSTIGQLQRQMISATRQSPTAATSALEIQDLKVQLDALRTRVDNIECGVVKLDERTLPKAARGQVGTRDTCRRDPDTPIVFANRPH